MQKVSFSEFQRGFTQQGADFFLSLRREYGDRVYMDVPLLFRIYYLFHPDDAHELLVNLPHQVDKPGLLTRLTRSSFGNGIFTSDGAFWRRQRRLMQPVFHHGRIGKFASRMVAHTAHMLDTWKDGDLRYIDADMHALTLTIVVDALFSADISGSTTLVGQAMKDLGIALNRQGNSPVLTFMPDWFPLPFLRRKKRGVETINRILYQMLRERREKGEDASPQDLLSALVFAQDAETGEQMSDGQVRDELMTVFIAGHETTAVLLGWVWTLLAKYPLVEVKLVSELKTVLDGRLPTLEDLPHLEYTGYIIKEVLRLYPPVWFIMRQAREDIMVGGETLRKNSIIFTLTYEAHRDERWFATPADFMPERWAGDLEKTLPKGAYYPFGMGPRVCIGNGFALMEAQLLLATIAQRFHVEFLSEPRPLSANTTLTFAEPVQVRLYQRL